MWKKNEAFTLIEMLIVLMIIAILIILIVPNLGKRSQEVNSKGCEALVAVVQAQVDAYYAEHSRFPTSLNALVPEYLNEEQKTCNDKELGYDNKTGKVRG
ncbi:MULTISPECIES: competence type IV pilus major pilin ComGC [Clostridia]|uniref:competence type IV pilus major pilin ComGC n=1 Tax=Clostridia TaxID=186801 RepID=UPI000EA3E275|nr:MULTISPECIES: competence type IV pilus major pilin ComGC [Clostridia]NBJ71673.1 prepilin-type N-terminal cleavage/methylation domain-containing protein [Roseburia sp. 1XD42-34]RKI73887.1 prepilin-type N-terminal cleavage/methylation domain-containing protein [Clostridium sp. 1xD42-85]